MCDIPSFSDIGKTVSDAVSSLFGGGTSSALSNTASDAAASNLAGAVPDLVGSAAPVASTALAAIPTAADVASSFDLGSLGVSGLGGTGGGTAFTPTAAAAAPVTSVAAAAPSIAASPVGGGGGGISAAALGAAPGSDLGGNAPFGSDTVPDQALTGKPAVPTDSSGFDLGKVLGINNVKDALGPLIAGGGLLATGLKGNQPLPNQNELASLASNNAAVGKQLTDILSTGKLPPGIQQGFDQAAAASKAHIRSQYAQMGLTGSTMEQQALQQVDQQVQAEIGQTISALVQEGLGANNAAAGIYQQLQTPLLAQDKQLSDAIATFAKSLAPGTA